MDMGEVMGSEVGVKEDVGEWWEGSSLDNFCATPAVDLKFSSINRSILNGITYGSSLTARTFIR